MSEFDDGMSCAHGVASCDPCLEHHSAQVRALEARRAERDAQCAAMREALEHCRHRPHEHNPLPDFTVTHCEVIDRALASDAGRAYRAALIERCAKALVNLPRDCHCDDGGQGGCAHDHAIDRCVDAVRALATEEA